MQLRIKFGNARIVFDVDQYDHANEGEEYFGGGIAEVSARDWLRIYKRNEFTLYGISLQDVEERFREGKDARVSLTNDDFIVFLNAASTEPRRNYEIGWNGLAYWLCHDVTHAMHDVYGGAVDVNSVAEERTLYEGAILAREHGISLEQIVRELVRAETAYRERFKTGTEALNRFLHQIETTV